MDLKLIAPLKKLNLLVEIKKRLFVKFFIELERGTFACPNQTSFKLLLS